jgi:hypothetical protein
MRLLKRTTGPLLHVVLPTFMGGCIYLLWRTKNLRLFSWFDAVGATEAIEILRLAAAPAKPAIEPWLRFSLPAGLWMFALVAGLRYVWRNGRQTKVQAIWLSLAALLGPGSELAQGLGLLSGRFDYLDLGCYVTAYVAALCFTPNPEEEYEMA